MHAKHYKYNLNQNTDRQNISKRDQTIKYTIFLQNKSLKIPTCRNIVISFGLKENE